ncbi:MAG: hypothetical protein PHG27_05850 [Massilibacteroides sp.]|nr:hypothetical protein [Massilibacteroides sp.]MDD3062989.1 hypothetical protein [Massilibacteroides sp.]MDD4115108.1 hypothetical protein [Massilibacteroides sp.]MDD4660980.1 hypothetical protein [Massilibacteroides sp.]
MLAGLLIPIVAIVCSIGLPIIMIIILGVQAQRGRHAERIAMIEKGVVLEEPEKKANRYPALRNGLVMIGLSLGLIIGLLVEPYLPNYGDYFSLGIPAFTILFGGIGFVIYFFFSRKMQEKENNRD